MNVEHSYWEGTFLALRRAILEADTIDVLMRKALHIISTTYRAEGVLWVGLEDSAPEACRAYATTTAWRAAGDRQALSSKAAPHHSTQSFSNDTTPHNAGLENQSSTDKPQAYADSAASPPSGAVRRFRPAALPHWLVEQQTEPTLLQLGTGDLILPITEAKGHSARIARGSDGVRPTSIAREVPEDIEPASNLTQIPRPLTHQQLRFIFQFWRPVSDSNAAQATASRSTSGESPPRNFTKSEAEKLEADQPELLTSGDSITQSLLLASESEQTSETELAQAILSAQPSEQELESIQGWSPDEIRSLRSSCHLLLLATDALSWKRRLEQAQQHTSLLSRTSHLLNSSFHPDLIVKKILAEVGQSIRCDRAILVDLRRQMASILSLWERPRHSLKPIEESDISYALWQDIVDLFMQGGASYIEMTLTEDEAEPLQSWLGKSGAGSALVLPIFIREDFLGTVTLLSHRRERNYFLDELQIAGQGTEQLAIAMAMIQSARTNYISRESTPLQATPSAQEQLQDALTGLPNLQALEQELNQLSAPSVWAFRDPFSLVICDLDYFKLVNDTHGNDIGDRVLQRIAQRLRRQLRRNTPLYRYGGEEFVIFLEHTELEKAKDVAERLRRSVHSLNLRTTSGTLEITASFGVAQQQQHCDRSALDVLKRAEKALFEAKRLGRDRVEGILAEDLEPN